MPPPHHHKPARRTIGGVNEPIRKKAATETTQRAGPGRPATGKSPSRTFRLSDEFMARLDSWAARQSNSRSEAIRRLVEFGLTVNPKSAPTTRARAERASELAAKVIDKLATDWDAEEKATRKRRLIKGPEEFRDVRVDRVKK